MNEERRHERELLKTKTEAIREMRKSLDDWMEVVRKLGIDLDNCDQTRRFLESKRVNAIMSLHLFLKRLHESSNKRQMILDQIELQKAKHEFFKLSKSCIRFPKWLRIRIHRKQIKYLANRILEYTKITNDPTIYTGSWEIADTFRAHPHLQRIILSTSMKTEGETKDE